MESPSPLENPLSAFRLWRSVSRPCRALRRGQESGRTLRIRAAYQMDKMGRAAVRVYAETAGTANTGRFALTSELCKLAQVGQLVQLFAQVVLTGQQLPHGVRSLSASS